jgi:hypothetical protein
VAADHVAQTSPATASLLRLHAQRQRSVGDQERLAQRFIGAHPSVAIAQVIALPEDVHDLNGLRQVGELLVGADRPTSEEN